MKNIYVVFRYYANEEFWGQDYISAHESEAGAIKAALEAKEAHDADPSNDKNDSFDYEMKPLLI